MGTDATNTPRAQRATWIENEVLHSADGWFRGDSFNFYPQWRDRADERDIDQIIKQVLAGWMPEKPILDRKQLVTAFGSCFARHIEDRLTLAGFQTSISKFAGPEWNQWSNSLIIKCGGGFVNTASLRTQLEWIFDDTMPPLKLWRKSDDVIKEYLDNNRDYAAQIFNGTDFFVFTLGLSEAWYDKRNGKILWSSVPKSEYDPDIYGFRVMSVDENLQNMRAVVDVVRRHRGNVPIVFALSPVVLNATFRPVSAITANSVSKAILRVAVDELMRERTADKSLFYFPSYEIVTSWLHHGWHDDGMHPSDATVELLMEIFLRAYAGE